MTLPRARPIVSAVALLCLLAADEARAQAKEDTAHLLKVADEDDGRTEERPAALPLLYASLAGLHVLDIQTTRRARALGAHELNPVMRHDHVGLQFALKTAATVLVIAITEQLWKKHPAAAVAVMLVSNLVVGGAVLQNARVIGTLR